jgi:hypothetical protein
MGTSAVSEAEWLACADPEVLLERLPGGLSDRKLRLFACACCGPLWHLVTEPRCRDAVAVALRFADGEATVEELKAAHIAAQNGKPLFQDANWAAAWTASPDALHAAAQASAQAAQALARKLAEPAKGAAWAAVRSGARKEEQAAAWAGFEAATAEAVAAERAWQADLLRELTGNSFAPVPRPDTLPSVVRELAAALYAGEDCSFALHDALEEAGHPELAEHFLNADHPRGCWALDLILGKV